MSIQMNIDLQVFFAVIMGIGGILMARKLLIGFFILKWKSNLDKIVEESNETPEQTKTRRKWDEIGAFLFAFGLIFHIFGSIFWY